MRVSMDGLRKTMIANHNSLVKKLNANIRDKSFDPHIIISPDEISRELNALRDCIVTLAFTSMEGEGGWKELSENTSFECFNPEDDE